MRHYSRLFVSATSIFQRRLLSWLLMAGLLSAFQCESKEPQPCPYDFVEKTIAKLEAQPKQNPVAELVAYTYQGATVYYVPSPCCDQYNTLYDACGQELCAPDGGATGKGDGRCADFATQATDRRVIWRDPR